MFRVRSDEAQAAPAAVEDCLCALRFVATQARTYDIDTSRLVVSGDSAGGHLALTTGMTPESAGLDRQCPGAPLPRVAAIIDWYGITDVGDLLDGPNRRAYAVGWLGSQPNREEIARRASTRAWSGFRGKLRILPILRPRSTIRTDRESWANREYQAW